MARITLRLPDELHERLKDAAEREKRTLTAQVLYLLDKALPAKRRPMTPEEKERARKSLESLPEIKVG